MKIAIHSSKGSFSKNWISYCEDKNISYKIVDCYKSDIIKQLDDCNILMWHFHQANAKDVLFAKQLLFAVQVSRKKVFPDFNTCWHFDDKVGQKYLFESINAPLVPSYVFYSKSDALQWIDLTSFPKVFKLRGGAGSSNVMLVRTKEQAKRLIFRSFNRGFRHYNFINGLKDQWRLYKMNMAQQSDILDAIGRFFILSDYERVVGRDKGYVYFQDYIEGCSFDIRIKVIGNRAWGFKRFVREHDFRASGSHSLVFSNEDIPLTVVSLAFDISRKLNLQTVAFDFLLTREKVPLLTELSYAFGYDEGENYGYWDANLEWHNERFNPFGWMIDDLINSL